MTTAPDDPLIGRVLEGRYRVIERVGEGGMATVYRGLDLRLDRPIAIKIMRAHLFHDEAFRQRFLREARTAASITHPHVVGVYDQGEDAGHMFLVMEYVHGTTLRHVLQEHGALPVGQSLDIMRRVLQALSAAHRAGLVHRDVKPENVLLGDGGVVKVADFGLARAATSHTVTGTSGVLLGTVAYLSPEQIERGQADARSDVYAAGLLLVEMLTGEKAFSGDTAIHVAYQHVHGGVPLPSTRDTRVPTELDDLVATATARDPDDRPKDAGAFLELVEWTRSRLSPEALGGSTPLVATPAAVARSAPAGVAATSDSVASTTAYAPTAAAHTTAYSPIPASSATESTASELPVRRPRRRWRAVLIALVVGAAMVAWFFLLGPGAQRTIPDVTNQPQAQALATISAADLSTSIDEVYSETVPAGQVVDTDPAAGAQARRGSTVVVHLSRGPERYAVPTLAGQTLTNAQTLLADTNLAQGKVTYAFDEKVAKDAIISTNPKAGASVKPGTPVALVISKGREPITVTDYTGKPAKGATAALTKAGLKVDATAREFSATVAEGSVIRQSPSSGTLYKGDTVTFVVSKGPELISVPLVVGLQEGRATKELEDAGFQVEIDRVLGGFFGTVRSQSIDGGSSAPKGSVITLTIV